MRATVAPAKRLPGWLRLLGWVGFAALFLATCLVAVRSVVLGRGHARVQELAKRHRIQPARSAQPKRVGDAAVQSAAKAGSAQSPIKGTPVRELPLVGMAFSDDPAVREEFRKLVEELDRISNALAGTSESGRKVSRVGHVINFRTVLENLGIVVPEGMTEAAAAAEFLRHMEKMSGAFAQLRSALETGPWDWGEVPEWFSRSESAMGRQRLAEMLRDAARATFGLAQARWRTGDNQGSWGEGEMLQLLSLRAGDDATLSGTFSQHNIQFLSARAVGVGISLGGWTDDQLARIPQSLASYDALLSVHHGLETELSSVEEFNQSPADVRAWFEPHQAEHGRFGSTIRRWCFDSASEQQIKDNLAVVAADSSYVMAQFDLQKRVYAPPMPGERKPSMEILADRSVFTDFYFLPFKELVGWNGNPLRDFFGWDPRDVIRSQAASDQARLAAALELQHRVTGQYPETLDAVGGAFPGGMPHDVATGQPYLYERTADGAYKLWGTGIDQTNNSGDPKKDILFTLPKIPPP